MRRASPAGGPREVSQGKPASEAAMTIRARCRSAMNGEATTMSTEFRSPSKPVMSSDVSRRSHGGRSRCGDRSSSPPDQSAPTDGGGGEDAQAWGQTG